MTSIDQGSPAGTLSSGVDAYVDAVAQRLAGVPTEERDELLSDVREQLEESIAEQGPDLESAVGDPTDFAHEFLASAGFEADDSAHEAGGGGRGPGTLSRLLNGAEASAARYVSDIEDRYPELRSAWVVGRGWMLGQLVAVILGGSTGILPRAGGSMAVGLVLVVAGIWASLELERRRADSQSRTVRWLAILAGVAAVVVFLGASASSSSSVASGDYDADQWVGPYGQGECLINSDGVVIENLHPFSSEGTPLEGVLIYDQTGHPLDNLCPTNVDDQGREITTEYATDVNGASIINVFPREQTRHSVEWRADPRTGSESEVRSEDAVAPPAIVIPQLSTSTSTTTSTIVVLEETPSDPASAVDPAQPEATPVVQPGI